MKRKVRRFLREYRIREISSKQLIRALREQGYTVLKFNRLCNDEDLDELIDALHLRGYIASSRGFTYANADYRLVFVHEDLSEKESCMVLAHEQGHITCGHMDKQPILGEDVRQENEANEFAHCLLKPGAWERIKMWIRRHRMLASVLAALCALLIIAGVIWSRQGKPSEDFTDDSEQIEDSGEPSEENEDFGEYYITATGDRYHTADCGFVKDKPNVRRMTKEEYASGLFTPCSRCLPEEDEKGQ